MLRHSCKWFALVRYFDQDKVGPTVYARQQSRSEHWDCAADSAGHDAVD